MFKKNVDSYLMKSCQELYSKGEKILIPVETK